MSITDEDYRIHYRHGPYTSMSNCNLCKLIVWTKEVPVKDVFWLVVSDTKVIVGQFTQEILAKGCAEEFASKTLGMRYRIYHTTDEYSTVCAKRVETIQLSWT